MLDDPKSLLEQTLKILEPLINPVAEKAGAYDIEGRDNTPGRQLSFGDQRAFAALVGRIRPLLSKEEVQTKEEDATALYALYQRGLVVYEAMSTSPGPVNKPGAHRERFTAPGRGIGINDSLFMKYPRLANAYNIATLAMAEYLDEVLRHSSFALVPWDPEEDEEEG